MASVNVETPQCVVCGKRGRVVMDRSDYERWRAGELLQYAARSLSADEREQLLTGTHALCWYSLMRGAEDE